MGTLILPYLTRNIKLVSQQQGFRRKHSTITAPNQMPKSKAARQNTEWYRLTQILTIFCNLLQDLFGLLPTIVRRHMQMNAQL